MKRIILTLLSAAILFGVSGARAQFLFCKIEGQKQGVIRSENPAKGLKDFIPILSIAGGVRTPFDPASGHASGKRQHQPLVLVKNLDKASPKLFLAAVTQENLKRVICDFRRDVENGTTQPYFRIELSDARIVESDINGNGLVNQGVRETVQMTFERISLEDLIGGTVAEDDWSER